MPLLVDHDPERLFLELAQLRATPSGIMVRCRLPCLPRGFRGLSIGYTGPRWKVNGGRWTLLDATITHVSLCVAEAPLFAATGPSCRFGGKPVTFDRRGFTLQT